MKIPLSRFDKKVLKIIREIGRKADQENLSAYAVGGFVRDLILKKNNFDLDITVEGNAIGFGKFLVKGMNASLTEYGQFGTATLILPDGFKFDLVSARKESYPYPGALPVVQEGTIQDDLFRRDFTVNAMAIAINGDKFGELVDHFYGLRDLKAKEIRILHERSFLDDPTRILRAVRFEQRLGFHIEKKTLALLKSAIKNDVVKNVKLPRYFAEFKKILEEPQPKKAMKRLAALGGFRFIDGKIKFGHTTSRLFDNIARNIIWFKRKFSLAEDKNIGPWLIYFMALVDQIPFNKTVEILEKFNLSKEDRGMVLLSKFVDRMAKKLSAKILYPYEVYTILKPLSYEATLFLYSYTSSSTVKKRIDDFLKKYDSVSLQIGGDDLKVLGVLPGRQMGVILEAVLHEKINGRICSRKEELKFAKQLRNR